MNDINKITKGELESLYLENDLDIKKIAEKTGWDVKEIAKKSFLFLYY